MTTRFEGVWLALALLCSCRLPSPVSIDAGTAIADAGAPKLTFAVPLRETMLKKVHCLVPDGGARVTTFDAHRVPPADCAVWPLACATLEARAEVLRRFDAGTLEFPQPQRVTRTNALGWFEVPLEVNGLVVVECADGVVAHAPSGFDTSFTDPTVELWPLHSPDDPRFEGRLLVINPALRRAEVIDGATWPRQPPELLALAWATTLEGAVRTKAPSQAGLTGGGLFGGPAPVPPTAAHAMRVTVRLVLGEGLTQRPAELGLIPGDGGAPQWVETRTSQHTFEVEPGPYTTRVVMAGAAPAELPLEVSQATTVELPLSPGIGTSGRVVDAQGAPVSGAVVAADGEVVTTTDANGDFALKNAAARLRAWHAGVGVSDELTAREAGAVKLVLSARSDVQVHLEAPDGGAVYGLARVSRAGVTEDLTRTVEYDRVIVRNGVLSLAGLSAERHEVLVLTREWKAARFSLEVGDAPVRLTQRLEPRPLLDGVVVRAGRPVAGARVRFGRPDAIFGYLEDETQTDERGHFQLGRSLPGEATILIDAVTLKRTVPSRGQRFEVAR